MGKPDATRLFGTDGIRSRFGQFPLDETSLKRLGKVLGLLWEGKKVLLGRDTRESGPECQHRIISGMDRTVELTDIGVISTPGFSYIMDHSDFDFGVMLTASHNPYVDNGIKIFDGKGEKISETLEREIEIFFEETPAKGSDTPGQPEPATSGPERDSLHNLYINFLKNETVDLRLDDLRCVVDCANGATHLIAPIVFGMPGFDAHVFNIHPDGKNINDRCGSTHPDAMRGAMDSFGAELGIAFDGDGDRVLFMDRRGRLLDGDHALVVMSDFLDRTDPRFNKNVVGTIMSNLGMEKALERRGIKLIRTAVGDKRVYAEMTRRGAVLGGEPSGHIILRHLQKSGDGILSALFFLKSLSALDLKIEHIWETIPMFPQVTRNIPIIRKRDLDSWPELNERIGAFEETYGKNGRVVVRYSGTEPKIRIMMEAGEIGTIENNIGDFVRLIKTNLGD